MAQPAAALNWLPPLALGLWGAVLLQAWSSGRLNLLLQEDFHWLVLLAGALLIALAVIACCVKPARRSGVRPAVVMALAAPVMLLLPVRRSPRWRPIVPARIWVKPIRPSRFFRRRSNAASRIG